MIALPIEAVGDWAEKKLKSNADSHVEAVRKSRKRRGKNAEITEEKISIEKLKSVYEWSEKAREIDAEDDVLSAAWRATLDQLLDDSAKGDELLTMLVALPKATMRYFFETFHKRRRYGDISRLHTAQLRSLEETGLITAMLDIRWTVLAGIVIVLMFFASQEVPSLKPVLLVGGGVLLVTAFGLSQIYKPTAVGEDILARFNLYLNEKDKL